MDNTEVIQLLKDSFELKRQEKYKHAMELLYKALSICPDNSEILAQVAELHLLLQNPASAKAIYEKLLERSPDDVSIMERLVEYYISVHAFDKAKVILEKFILAYPSQKAYEIYIYSYLTMQNFERVVEFYKEKELENYNNTEINKYYAAALSRLKNYEEAEKIFKREYSKNQFDENFQYYYAQTLYELEKFDEAYSLLRPFLQKTESARLLNLAGEIELANEHFEPAINLFSHAIKLKYSGLHFYNLATAYFLNGQLNEAKAFYVKAISASPEIDEYRYAQAYLYYKSGDLKKSQQVVNIVLERNPRFREAVLLKANILFDENQFFKAEKVLREYAFDRDTDVEYLEIFAKVSRALYKNHSALDAYENLVRLVPNNIDNRFELARLYFDMTKYDKAARIIVSVISSEPMYVGAYVLAAKIYMKMVDFENALNMTEKVLKLDLNNEEAFYLKALCQVGLSKLDDAIATLKQLLLYNPQKSEAYALIGACYSEKQDLDSGIKYYEEAVALDNQNTEYLQALAALYEKNNDIKAALRSLFMANVLKPDNKNISDRLINLYVEDKQYKNALKLLRIQISKTKEAMVLQDLKNRLAQLEMAYKSHAGTFKFVLWRLFRA